MIGRLHPHSSAYEPDDESGIARGPCAAEQTPDDAADARYPAIADEKQHGCDAKQHPAEQSRQIVHHVRAGGAQKMP